MLREQGFIGMCRDAWRAQNTAMGLFFVRNGHYNTSKSSKKLILHGNRPFNSRAEPSSSSYWGSIRLFSSSGESISCPRWLVGICLSMWCWVCKVSQRLLSLLVAVTVHRAVSYLKCVWRICKSDGLDCSWTFAQSDNKSELRLCGYCLRDSDSILDWIEGEVFLWNPKNAF